MATDPVCGMQVNEAGAKNVSELAGIKYFFCGAGCKRKFDAAPQQYLNRPVAAPSAPAEKAADPVCGMQVTVATAKHVSEHAGKKFYFCCNGCKTKFEAAPAGYLNKTQAAHAHHHAPVTPRPAAAPGKDVTYTCPMHPEVISKEPGKCPRCGMDLEAKS